MTALEFEFKIPLKRDDLRSNESANEYVVSEIYNLKDLEIKIEECKLRAGEIGCDFILEYFPTVFSILHHFNTLDFKVLCSFYEDVILKESDGLFNSLSVILADDDMDPELRNKMLNITKMLLYVTIEFMKSFQEKIDKIYSLVINEKRKKNTKLMKLKEEHNWDWEANERKALIIINKIVKLPLQRLWDPPTPEEEFVRMIDDCCYNILEKPSVTSANMKPTRDLIFEILGILIKHYNNAISCKVKIVQLLKLYEHLVVILAQAVIFLVEKYNCRSLIKELILEIIETEEETDTYTQDGSSSRQFSNFIVEIAKLRPQLVLPYINLLINNLSSDPYSMRICVLTVMAEIIINVLQPQGASLSEENIKLRNSFLDHLLDHIYDNNTFVRSRALKLWQSLYKEKSVPTSYIIPLLKRATDRLNDKSSNVVKNSIQLITSMLEENLYGPTLESSAVKQNLRAVKLQLIEAENAKSEPSVFKIWYYSRTDISDFVFKQLKDDEEEGIFDSDNGQSSNDVSLVQKSDVDLSETLSQLQKDVVAQDMEKIFKTLIEFENEHIGKSNFLKSVNDKVQYYEWILGHICKNNTNVREDIIARFASCEDSEDIKNIIDESIQLEDENDLEFGSEKKILTYCEDFLRFVETTSAATAVIREILIRKSAVEVLEAVEFFKVAHQFNLAGADEGVRSMLLLINSKEPGFKDAVKNAFKVLYLQNENSNEYESAVEAVNKLIVLLKKVTHEQKQALANLIKEWVLNKDLGPDFILVLWEKYTRKLPNTSYEDSTAAAVLISMYASGKPEVIKTNMDMLIKYGLGVNQNNYAFLKQTISMFNALFGIKHEGVSTRYPPDAEIFEKLLSIVHEQFTNLRNGLYPEIAMEAISVIYRLSKNPDTTVGKILKLIHKNLIDEQVENTRVFNCQEELLARFVTVLSHAVFCHWQYLETDVLNELKRRHAKTNAKIKKEKKTTMNKSNSKSMIQKSLAENTTTTDSFEDDTQALASEQIAESVRMVCEKELLYGDTLFAKFSLMILSICKQPEKYTNTRLRSAASLALSKLMMVSSVFCSENIQLFVTLMEKSNDIDVRNNLVLAFGDLTFRFPNITDVWTGYFYNRLKDESTNVRYTALVVISHLITNEMIKVRSQMSDVALCLVDSDKLVQNHALHLFYELSLKGNTLYNVMADIISRLSHPDHRPDEKTFQTIMKVLMKLITKDRHLEAIVEKLCHRIRGALDERQCIDLSYCLTLISYSEKTFQKLLDNIICYADKLNYARVHRNFTTIIINCKKLKTGKISEAALELDQKISIILSKGMDNLDADFLKPPKTPMKTPHRANSSMFKTPASTRKSRLRSAKKIIDFDSDDGE